MICPPFCAEIDSAVSKTANEKIRNPTILRIIAPHSP